jgi:hypothetical protein
MLFARGTGLVTGDSRFFSEEGKTDEIRDERVVQEGIVGWVKPTRPLDHKAFRGLKPPDRGRL